MEITARATTATGWADCKNTNEPIDALIISSEDAGGDTLVPRLMAAEADLTKIHIFKTAKTKEGERAFGMDKDLPALRKTLEGNPAIRLIVVDPIMNHLGRLEGNSEQELRSALTPLGLLATTFNLAIILVTHFNKSVGMESIQRVGGATGMTGAVRVVWAFAENTDTGTREMLPIKANIAKDFGGLEYEIVDADVEIDGQSVTVGRMVFGKQTHASIDAALKKNGGTPTKIGLTIEWLADFMSDGEPKSYKDVIAAANLKGHEDKIVRNAYKKLGGLKPTPHGVGDFMWQLSKAGE
jgi:AAA domain-containing protein